MRPLHLVWMPLVFFIALGAAQDLKPSFFWKNPNITSTKDDRIGIASTALEKAVSMLQSNGQFNDTMYASGRLYAQMAEFDRLTNQTKYKQTLKQCFTLAESINPGFLDPSLLSIGLDYGYAAARAYTAYQDPDFLDLAVTSWTSARRYTISKEQAGSGAIDANQFNLSTLCQGATLTGGTYMTTALLNYTDFDGLASGSFLIVSALLAEATSNRTYLDAAIESANFIQSHLLNPSNTVAAFLFATSNCSVYITVYAPCSGIFIEGLAILADITRDTSTEALLRTVIVAVTTNTLWQGLDGVIATVDTGSHYIVKALATLYDRNTTSSDLREYIKEYIGVQYNAVIEKATSGGSNIYGLSWTGPPSAVFSSGNQTVAMTALLSGIQLVDNEPWSKSSDNPTSSRTPMATASPVLSKKNPTAAIIGGVVGGFVVLVVSILCVLLCRKRHHQGNHTPLVVDGRSSQILTPFMAMPVPDILGEHHINRTKNARYPVEASRGQSSTSPREAETDATRMDVQIESTTLVAAASPPNPLHTERVEDMRTEELLRVHNQRLLLSRLNDLDDELPPEYSEGRTT